MYEYVAMNGANGHFGGVELAPWKDSRSTSLYLQNWQSCWGLKIEFLDELFSEKDKKNIRKLHGILRI